MGSVNSTTIKNSIDNKNKVVNEDFIKSCSDILNEDNTEISKNIITKHITTTEGSAEMNLGDITADGEGSNIDLKNMVTVIVSLESSDVQQIKEEISKKMATSINDVLKAVSDTSFMNDLKTNTNQEFTKGLDILSANITNSDTKIKNENDIENITKMEVDNIVKNIVNTKMETNSSSYCGSDASGNATFKAGNITAKDGAKINIENSAAVQNAVKCFTNIQMTNDILNEIVNQAGWTVQTDNKTDTKTDATSESTQKVSTGWSMGAISGIIIIVIIIIIGGFLIKKFGPGGSISQRFGHCKNTTISTSSSSLSSSSSSNKKLFNKSSHKINNINNSIHQKKNSINKYTPTLQQIKSSINQQQDFSDSLNNMFNQQKQQQDFSESLNNMFNQQKKRQSGGNINNILNIIFNLD